MSEKVQMRETVKKVYFCDPWKGDGRIFLGFSFC